MADGVALKRIPYGEVDFRAIRQENSAYVDKTRYIEVLEKYGGDSSLIVRPRRFGKTLFTKMLEAYYDECLAEEFEKNFAGTYIGEHKTALANSFRVIHFDFSGFSSSPNIVKRFDESIRTSIETFFSKYPHSRQERILDGEFPDASSLLEAFFGILGNAYEQKLYVIVDEYDQFANNILASDVGRFRDMTSKEGFYKDFFTTLKKGTTGVVARVFITGVSVFSLDSMTSGFNIADKISTSMRFAGMFGFNESELRKLIPQVVDLEACGLTLGYVVDHMKEWYNGYRFSSRSNETVFNPTMCLYYLYELRREQAEPEDMVDSNLGQDLDKIEGILKPWKKDLVREVLELALCNKPIPFKEKPTDLNLNKEATTLDKTALLSTLFYFGFLTFCESKNSEEKPSLCIPNKAVRIQFFSYFRKYILGDSSYEFIDSEFKPTVSALISGNPEPFFKLVCNFYSDASGLHNHSHIRESDFQTLLVANLNLADQYDVQCECEVRGNDAKGYADILATPKKGRAAKYSYLIEIKHLKVEEGKNPSVLQDTVDEAKAQLARYSLGNNVSGIENLKRIVAVFVGVELKVLEVYC